jgi:hypothetical protein
MRNRFSLCVLAGALLLTTSAAEAQSAQRWSIQVSGISVGVNGDAYEGLSNGFGLEAQARLTPGLWSFGGGIQSSIHTLEGGPGLGDIDVTLAGVFFEPRRIIDVGSTSYAPYVSARLAILQQSLEVEVSGVKIEGDVTGTQLNAGGGVLFRMTPRVNLDLGATFGVINFGEAEIRGGGQTFTGEGGSGQNLVIRLGVAIGLGK